jgi:CelD/BcsL family acetyltransferase involved in cellulose biosynthesis
MICVRELHRMEDLAAVASDWDGLLRQTRHASFFQSLDWLTVYWRHYGHDQRLRCLLMERSEQLVGILPLVVRRERTRVGWLRMLTYPLDDWGTFYGPLGPEPREILLAGLQHVYDTPRDWDVLDLRWVNPHCDRDRTPQAMRAAGFPAYPQRRVEAGLVELQGRWSNYWSGRTSHWRNNVRRCEKKLAASGSVSYEHYRPAGADRGQDDPRWDLYDACEQVARHSWQATAAGTTLSHASIRPFLRDMHVAAARAGAVDLHLLRLDGQPAAFAYNYHAGGYVSGLRMGYDQRLARDGAGTLLTRRAIETCYRLGDHTYDFGADYLDGKRNWLTARAPVYRYTHFAWSAPRAQMLRLKRVFLDWLSRGSAKK